VNKRVVREQAQVVFEMTRGMGLCRITSEEVVVVRAPNIYPFVSVLRDVPFIVKYIEETFESPEPGTPRRC
jgi:hypothetical protein